MHHRKFDHALTLKITPEMRDEIDQAFAQSGGHCHPDKVRVLALGGSILPG